jgi:CubicO group peptidase (beta-lactamase class C family)
MLASDRVFARWSRFDSPGCVAGVVRAGQTVLRKGWGQADLEHNIAIGAATVFDVAAVAEQVTARAVLLLVDDGKLELDDSVRRWVGELPAWADRVTLRQLLEHSSGVRDYASLLALSGVRPDDVSTAADALALLSHQRRTSFAPGARHAASSSDYFLLSIVVQRAAGRSLARFAAERIFTPLGMSHSRFREDHTQLIANRAIGYAPRERGGYRIALTNHEQIGDGALYTTVDDLLRFAAAANDARATWAARSGGRAGYRAAVRRAPESQAAVAVLCNDAAADADALAAELAQIWLAGAAATRPAATPAATPATPAATAATAAAPATPPLWKFVGIYRTADTGEIVRFAVDDDALTLVAGGTRTRLTRAAAAMFTVAGDEWRFDDNLAVETHAGHDAIYAAFKPLAAAAAPLASYTGDYVSPELPDALLRIDADARGLRLIVKNLPPMRLSPTVADEFAADALPLIVRFARDRRGFWLYQGRPYPTLADLPFRRR